MREKLQHVENERQDDERSADPLGRAGELGVHALGLVLRHKGIGHAADGAAQAGGLAALEEHDADVVLMKRSYVMTEVNLFQASNFGLMAAR